MLTLPVEVIYNVRTLNQYQLPYSVELMHVIRHLKIFSALTPKELFYLSRLSRMFRMLLVTKRSKRAWNAAFKSVGVEYCPEGMTELEMASLLFDDFCQVIFYSSVVLVER